MSLSIALFIIFIEFVAAVIAVVTTKDRKTRGRRIGNLFGVFSVLTLLPAIGLAGSHEATGHAPGLGTSIALCVINAAAFCYVKDALERLYGVDPA